MNRVVEIKRSEFVSDEAYNEFAVIRKGDVVSIAKHYQDVADRRYTIAEVLEEADMIRSRFKTSVSRKFSVCLPCNEFYIEFNERFSKTLTEEEVKRLTKVEYKEGTRYQTELRRPKEWPFEVSKKKTTKSALEILQSLVRKRVNEQPGEEQEKQKKQKKQKKSRLSVVMENGKEVIDLT